jgi:hypothetical protein
MTSIIYGIKTRCIWFDLNDTSPNDAQTSNPSEINLVQMIETSNKLSETCLIDTSPYEM